MDRYVKLVLRALVLFLPGRAETQGDGPHNLPRFREPLDLRYRVGGETMFGHQLIYSS